jgi:hypothetical protein
MTTLARQGKRFFLKRGLNPVDNAPGLGYNVSDG